MKKVLLVIIDALASRIVEPALEANRLPNLRALKDAATLQADSIAIFPSITPAATSSLITGRYPVDHGVSGAYWYNPEEKRVVYFGYDIWAVLQKGIGAFFDEFLIKLNQEHLQAETLFQVVERQGLEAASLNYLIYHGDEPHNIRLAPLQRILPDAVDKLLGAITPTTTVFGPSMLYFGNVIQDPLEAGEALTLQDDMINHFGFNDDATVTVLTHLIKTGGLPDFTVAYFPENDVRSHAVGPQAALDHLEELDAKFGELFAQCGGLDAVLDQLCIVLTGDHSQSDVVEAEGAQEAQEILAPGIRLDELLVSFSVAEAGTPMTEENDLVACPNLRAAQFYFHSPTAQLIRQVIDELLRDPRIDQLLWNPQELSEQEQGFYIFTRDRGNLCFWEEPDGVAMDDLSAAERGRKGVVRARDVYGNRWAWEGDLRTVDGRIVDGLIRFHDYPNAFERVARVLALNTAGNLWATSRPGYEFCLEHTDIHDGGGSHGSLHVLDSVSPLWVAGAPAHVTLPVEPRSVDVMPLCLSILGLG